MTRLGLYTKFTVHPDRLIESLLGGAALISSEYGIHSPRRSAIMSSQELPLPVKVDETRTWFEREVSKYE